MTHQTIVLDTPVGYVVLRPQTPDDDDLIFQFFVESQPLSLEPDLEPLLRMQCKMRNATYRRLADLCIFIVEQNGCPLARLVFGRDAGSLRLAEIVVLASARATGIGTALIQHVIGVGEKAGLPVTLAVEIYNPVRALYHRLGFGPAEQQDNPAFVEMIRHPAVTQP